MMKQSGFTLIELLVVVAISGVILTGAFAVLQQTMQGTFANNNKTVVLSDINDAALYIRRDIQMAQDTNLPVDGTPQNSVTFDWYDFTLFEADNISHSVDYTLSDTNLLRNYDDIPSIIGRHITNISFSQDGEFINVSVTANVSGWHEKSKTLNFSIYMRGKGIR